MIYQCYFSRCSEGGSHSVAGLLPPEQDDGGDEHLEDKWTSDTEQVRTETAINCTMAMHTKALRTPNPGVSFIAHAIAMWLVHSLRTRPSHREEEGSGHLPTFKLSPQNAVVCG